jgi:oligopeptide transport system ATP-binding protein
MSDQTTLSTPSKPLLEVKGLTKHFPIKGGILGREVDRVHAVDGVSFHIEAGETLGISPIAWATFMRCAKS